MNASEPNGGKIAFETADQAILSHGWPRNAGAWENRAHARVATSASSMEWSPSENEQHTNPGSAFAGSAELGKRFPGASIYVVDDNPRVSTHLSALFAPTGLKVHRFSHAREFLEHRPADSVACLVLNIVSADFDHDDLRNRMRERRVCPIIYISDQGDIPSVVRVIKEGAIDFLTKPIDTRVLLSAISFALVRDVATRARDTEFAALQRRFSTLTPRERQVLPLVTGGMRNKQAAAALGISDVTLQIHRSQVMRKLAARSFAELIRMSLALGVAAEPPRTRWSWVWQEPYTTWAEPELHVESCGSAQANVLRIASGTPLDAARERA